MDPWLTTRLAAALASADLHPDEDSDIGRAFCGYVIDRAMYGSDVLGLLAALSAAYEVGDPRVKDEIVCAIVPSMQIRCVGQTRDLETYRKYRERILPYLPSSLQTVWRHWDRQLPFGAEELLD